LAAGVKDDPTTTNRRLKTEKKQTILTGDQRHRDYIKNGKLTSRHADRPYVFYLIPTALYSKTILASPQMAHLALPHKLTNPSQSQKSHFFTYTTIRMINLKY
jgi:hypothetical protein